MDDEHFRAGPLGLVAHLMHRIHDHRILSGAGTSTGEGNADEPSDSLSHDSDRRAVDFLPGSRAEGRADDSPFAWSSLVVANVRAALRSSCRSLPLDRARLPRVRTQRLAGPQEIRLHVRSLRRDHESLHRGACALTLHTLYA